MDIADVLIHYHRWIVDTWMDRMRNDRSTRYADEPESDLRILIEKATKAFQQALVHDEWTDLREFINMIGPIRLQGGFTLSEVQRAFERYRETVTPLIVANVEPTSLTQILLRLHHCMVYTVTLFSTYFQDLHERFLENQARYLEREVAVRTRELADSERKYKILVEDINDGYFVLVRGSIVFANNAFAKMHGYVSDEIIGVNYLNLVAPESKEEIMSGYVDGNETFTSPERLEYLRIHRDGRRLPTEMLAKISSYGGEVANIGICRDTSERVELERKTREAEKLNALAQLAASLAHEINNPLTAVKMNVQLFSERGIGHPESQELIGSTLREVEQIRRCVTEMMDLTIPFRLERKWVETRALIDGCLKIMDLRMNYQGINATTRLSSELRDVFVDPERIEQAVVNLLLNSLDVLPRGGRIFVSTRASQDSEGHWGEIHVADNGPGIPKEQLPYVFDPFYSHKAGGVGLGLANVKKIVQSHGGEVTVTQRRPKGLRFTLRLPQK